jgi:diguanylate cyclase (GGDEF)-like protein
MLRFDGTVPMKGAIAAVSMVLGCTLAAVAAPPASLTTLHAIRALNNAQASLEPPVVFSATVTYVQPGLSTALVQDLHDGIQVRLDTHLKLSPGDRVLIKGKVQEGFPPIVIANSVTVVGHVLLPRPIPASFDELNRTEMDSTRVTIRGVVRHKDLKSVFGYAATLIHMQAEGGMVDAWIDGADPNPNRDMFDDEIEVTGVSSGKSDGKLHHIGVKLNVLSFGDVKVLRRSGSSPWTLPITPIDKLLDTFHVTDRTARIRVQGTLTFYQPGSALVIQNGSDSLWITTSSEKPLRIGSRVDVTGFGTLNDNHLALASGEVRESSVYTPIAAQPMTSHELPNSKHIFDLVSVEGLVLMEVRKLTQDEYFLVSNGQVFSAIYYHRSVDGSPPPPMKQIPLGSRVRVSGICFPLQNRITYNHDLPSDILMRTQEDIAVVANPSWLNVRNLIQMTGLLFVLVVVVVARGWTVERKARRQLAAMAGRIEAEASLERRRSGILRDINSSRPLAEILEQIIEMVSFPLNLAPSWCEIADGEHVGDRPQNLQSLRVVRGQIIARSGHVLGTIAAAFDPSVKPSADESKYLSMAVELATVAIETRGLYSELLYRSEFDLLTNIHNRFSLDKHLEACILNAGIRGSIFGLIYVDLDKFKQINDVHGHRAGDLYLQGAVARMNHQLRSMDVLARLGGDEFAVLVPSVHCRADVEEIALRLERCFDEPFQIDEHLLSGSASVGIAVFPADASTKAGLFSVADIAMYKAKNGKGQIKKQMADLVAGEQVFHLQIPAGALVMPGSYTDTSLMDHRK